jgi:hypothetical protein
MRAPPHWFIVAGVGLLVAGCIGSLEVTGTLWQASDDDDSSAVDDDDSAVVDDDDVVIDDDDMVGGPVFCGPTVEVGPEWTGGAAEVYTGEVEIDLNHAARGGAFSADWTGCEAKHFYDDQGEYICGILWDAYGPSYGEQLQSTRLISRFDMAFAMTENTCDSSHPDAGDRSTYFRLDLPYGGPLLTVMWSGQVNTQPAQMHDWTTAPWTDDDETPEEIDFSYHTALVASGP